MLVDDLKKRLAAARKENDEVAKDVLRVALGEIQTIEHRQNRPLTDDESTAIVRKLVKSNEETLSGTTGERVAILEHENEILAALLPKSMSVEEIAEALAPQREAIRAAKSDGQATGLAMKHLKSTGAVFDGAMATEAVKRIRA